MTKVAGPVFPLGTVLGGVVSLGPRPQADELEKWCDAVARSGVSHVVSLITTAESADYGIDGEEDALATLGVGFTSFPVNDFSIPEMDAFAALVDDLKPHLAAGKGLHIHCAGGVGRAGTLASCLLVADGILPQAARQRVSEARGMTCPETDRQRDFIEAFATRCGVGRI